MELLLPKGYLSPSQMEMWIKSQERYKKEYFMKGKKLDTKYMRFGSYVHKLIETGEAETLLPTLKIYPIREMEIRIDIQGVPTFCIIDGYDDERHIFGDNKTGKVPWTYSKLYKSLQFKFYATVLRKKYDKMPECCDVHWIETTEGSDDSDDFWEKVDSWKLKLTGKVKPLRRRFNHGELDEFEKEIVRVAHEISNAYKAFINEI